MAPHGVCCFVLLNRSWGIVAVPEFHHERAKWDAPTIWDRSRLHEAARLNLRSLLWGQTLTRSSFPQTSHQAPHKEPCTGNTRCCEEKGLWHRGEIWPPGCGKPKGSRRARLRHLASHSPVAKSPSRNLDFCSSSSSRGCLWLLGWGRPRKPHFLRSWTPQGLTPQKAPQPQVSSVLFYTCVCDLYICDLYTNDMECL